MSAANATKAHLKFNKLITPIIRSHADYIRKFSHSYPKTNTTKFWMYRTTMRAEILERKLTAEMRNIVGFKRVFVSTYRANSGRTKSACSIYVYSDTALVNSYYGNGKKTKINKNKKAQKIAKLIEMLADELKISATALLVERIGDGWDEEELVKICRANTSKIKVSIEFE